MTGLALALIGMLVLAGCVERTLTINSRPSGALVMLNDQEVGRTPVTVHFEWYGDYDVILRNDGCETLKTHTKVDAPWYQWPGLDLFSEVFWPGRIHDHHDRHFELQPIVYPTADELLGRADALRAATLGISVEELGAPRQPQDPEPAVEDQPSDES
jgi:hypothetical protein